MRSPTPTLRRATRRARLSAQRTIAASPLAPLRRARVWLRLGQAERARACYRAQLRREPWTAAAHHGLLELARSARDWPELERVARRGLDELPEDDRLHKALVDALVADMGAAEARRHFGLTQVSVADFGELGTPDRAVVACAAFRNEIGRLPTWFAELRRIGVAHFLIVDNDSTDGTREYLENEDGVELWTSSMSFRGSNFGVAWLDVLLRERFEDRWILVLDADEILSFPGVESRPIARLCDELDSAGFRATSGILIDMYSEGPLAEAQVEPGRHPLEVLQFFDRRPYSRRIPRSGPFGNQTLHIGGCRERVFGSEAESVYWLTQTPLIRYTSSITLVGGSHFTSLPADRIHENGCAVLHFKLESSMAERAAHEVERGEHSGGGAQYRHYVDGLLADPKLSFYDDRHSIRFAGSDQLVELGLLRPVPPPVRVDRRD